MPKPIILVDDDENEIALPAVNQLCDDCKGDGHHDNPAFSNGFTRQEMDEQGEEFLEDYLAGHYDVPCETCSGRGVVAVPDFEQWTPEQRALWERQQREIADMKAMERAEARAFGYY